MSIESQIREEIALVLALAETEISPARPLIEYGLDSVRSMEIVVGVEDLFGIEIADHEIAQLDTLARLVACVTNKLAEVQL